METTVALSPFTGFGSGAHAPSTAASSFTNEFADEAPFVEALAPISPQQPNTNLSLSSAVGSSQLGRWNDGTWRTEAACSTMDTLIFFPIGETGPAAPQVALAKKVCTSCPVREQCLEFAIATIQNDGIWGGTTEDERRLIKRARRAAARKAAARTAA
jgi:WhiB family transcriptional regulator, redox-sensing transcriptional regulator